MTIKALYPATLPSLTLDFSRDALFDSRITFTRASTATRVNASGYIETVAANVPRIDYDPVTKAAKGLLIELQRANLLLSSDDLRSSAAGNAITAWSNNNATITVNTLTAPTGTVVADTMITTTAGGSVTQTTQAFGAGTSLTFSVYAKQKTSRYLRLEIGGLVSAWFDLLTGVVGSNGAGGGDVLYSAHGITAAGNGWYRCHLTATTTTITSAVLGIYATESNNVTSALNSEVYLWGSQVEGGLFSTSYIPTTSASATRIIESAVIAILTPWFNAAEGSMCLEFTTGKATSNLRVLWFDDGTSSNFITVLSSAASLGPYFAMTSGGTSQYSPGAVPTSLQDTTYKFSYTYKTNDTISARNGVLLASDALAAIPTVTILRIGRDLFGNQLNGCVRKIAYYPKRLTNTELQALTNT